MNQEKRTGDPIPKNLYELLTDAQLSVLEKIQGFGWRLKFVRRTPETVVILENLTGQLIGQLDDDGRVNMDITIPTRESSNS